MIRVIVLTTFLLSCIKPANVENQNKIIYSMANTIVNKYPTIEHLNVDEFKSLKKNEYYLVDVRTLKEQQVSMIDGAISATEFEKIEEADIRNKRVIFYCTIGERSSQYATVFIKKGVTTKVSNLYGSILAWIQAGGRLIDSENLQTKKVHVYNEAWSFVPKDHEAIWN